MFFLVVQLRVRVALCTEAPIIPVQAAAVCKQEAARLSLTVL